MEFGLQFFPDTGPEEKSAQRYWNECLDLVGLCDELGYTHVRTVEHYFEPYGGYSPSPYIFLTAASQRTRSARLITGAVLPVFNHPLKVAGEIGMLDAISNGRLECGFGRAFLPHEFQRLERSMDDSRARFDEGVAAIPSHFSSPEPLIRQLLPGSTFLPPEPWHSKPPNQRHSQLELFPAPNLVNYLDLVVTAPDGSAYMGNNFSGGWTVIGGSADRTNNPENVYLPATANATPAATLL